MKTSSVLITGMLWQMTAAILYGSSEEELSTLFEKYEIIQPMQVDYQGNFISFGMDRQIQRKRRSMNSHMSETMTAAMAHVNVDNSGVNKTMNQLNLDSQELFYYNITAFGMSYHLELHKKRRLIAPNAKVVRYSSVGRNEVSIDIDCVQAGHIMDQPHSSVVAITNCGGLAGLIRTRGDEFFIEPLENHYQKDNKSSPQQHVVYRRSSTNIPKERTNLGADVQSLMDNQRFKRHSKKNDYSMEVLLTADNEVIQFHGSEHVENYLVTLMNIVDEIYHDDSIGEHINIVLVRLCLLDQSRSGNLIVNEDPSNSLKNVCKWANDMQIADPLPSGKTYDHAIFLTRQNFGPAGYAHVSGMCHPLRSCTLNQEDGFSSAFVIAHETGHVLGMEHDGEGNKCGDEATMGSIMAPLVQAAFHRYHWSRCSQQELKSHIRKFDCLLDDPHMPDWGPVPLYPGIMYSMDDQCRFDFGKGYKRCTAFRNLDVCRTLWCSHDDNPMFCKTKNGPPVDGTECGRNMWCFQSHCVWRQQAEGWSKWSSYGACSRSCGTGVRRRRRDCKNPRLLPEEEVCRGDDIEYNICNNKRCTGNQDYRAEQCKGHRSLVYANRRHTWLPYESEHDDLKCELFCVSKETNDILSMGMPAADGTLCSYDDAHDICIDAMCVKVGCDKILGSEMKEDECGVCGGDGSQCHQLNGTYRKLIRRPYNSYMKMFSIPVTARKIWIQESSAINPVHMLAMKNCKTGRYILNQRNKLLDGDVNMHFIDAGTKWSYTRQNAKETIMSRGPLKTEIKIMLISRGRDRKTTINYSYVLHAHNLGDDVYRYELRKWYPCSVTCGTGTRSSRFGCRNKSTGKWVRKIHCRGSPPSRIRKKCFNKCQTPPSWQAMSWGACTRSCGGGTQSRLVSCQENDSDGTWQSVEDRLCPSQERKPAEMKECSTQPCQPSWRTSSWSTCGVSCGRGMRRRRVACRSHGRFVADSECADPKPSGTDACFLGACTENPCEKDQSILCKLDTMAKYCTIPGYHQLCCRSCYTYLVERQHAPAPKGKTRATKQATNIASPATSNLPAA